MISFNLQNDILITIILAAQGRTSVLALFVLLISLWHFGRADHTVAPEMVFPVGPSFLVLSLL